jgi:predicted N-acetyltransferase YhbS
LPEKLAKKLPRHPVPVAVLARLAVDLSVKGQGLGRSLIGDALTRCVSLSDQIGIHAVFVEAIDDEAVRFYERFGFVPLRDQPDKLFLRIDVARNALPKS